MSLGQTDQTPLTPMDLNRPILMNSCIDDWPCRSWTFRNLAVLLGDKSFNCRLAPKSCAQQMETQCVHLDVTLEQFCDWMEGKADMNNPLSTFTREDNSCYIDYKYMKNVFVDHPNMLAEVDWSAFGLKDFDGYDSTIWLSSEGANTPGHQDSYGFNLVTQICGRKLWILFPPEDQNCLYPTRVPYEESSVFTQVNIRRPDFESYPKFKQSHPVIVTLCPGQSLYVPRHWWHYVESLEPSISVNLWVPLKKDRESRLSEAVTRCLATNLIADFDISDDDHSGLSKWLNPTESLASGKQNLLFLNYALSNAMDLNTGSSSDVQCEGEEKKQRQRPTDNEDGVRDNWPEGKQNSASEENVYCHKAYDCETLGAEVNPPIDSIHGSDYQAVFKTSEESLHRDKDKLSRGWRYNILNSETSESFTLSRDCSCQDEPLLRKFAEKFRICNFHEVSSPFVWDENAKWTQKRKNISSGHGNKKMLKGDSHAVIEQVRISSDASDTEPAYVNRDSSSLICPGTLQLFCLNPCSVDTFVNFMNNLCSQNQCRTCARKLDRNADLSQSNSGGSGLENNGPNSVDQVRGEGKVGGERSDLDSSAALLGATNRDCSKIGETTSRTGGHAGVWDEDKGENIVIDGDGDDKSTDLLTELSLSEVAEDLLTSVLHPDVIHQITVVLREQCQHRKKIKLSKLNLK